MSHDSILKAKQIDMSKVTYSDPKLNKYGGKQVWINHDKRKFVVQTPKMSCLFGLNVYSHDNGDDDLSVNLSFRGKDTNKSIIVVILVYWKLSVL